MRTLLSGLGAGFVLLVATACGGSSATVAPPAATSAAGGGAAAASCSNTAGTGQQVAIADFSFTPSTLSVSTGTSVTWTNGGSATHTVTFNNGPDCGQLTPGQSTTVTFSTAGTFAYHCKIHPQMTATITVS